MERKNVHDAYKQLLALIEQCGDGVLDKAAIAVKLRMDGHQATEEQQLALANRIYKVCIVADEPRFTWYDYADAIIYWPAKIDTDLLLNLSDEDFEDVIIYMAFRKRATYSLGTVADLRGEGLVNDLQRKSQ